MRPPARTAMTLSPFAGPTHILVATFRVEPLTLPLVRYVHPGNNAGLGPGRGQIVGQGGTHESLVSWLNYIRLTHLQQCTYFSLLVTFRLNGNMDSEWKINVYENVFANCMWQGWFLTGMQHSSYLHNHDDVSGVRVMIDVPDFI